MNRRQFLAGLGAALPLGAQRRRGARRPNIVVIMADDMGFSDIGCYGSEIDTPNVNRLSERGIRFTQFYNTARCCPSRASLLTGLYSHQAGVGHMVNDRGYPGYRGDLSRDSVTIAEALKPAGYRTYAAGKWHVTPLAMGRRHNWPLQRGFDRFFGTLFGGGNYYNPASLLRDNEPVTSLEPGFYYTDAISDAAASFVEQSGRGAASPFFMYVAYTAPHWPLHALEEDIAKYRDRYKAGWDALRAERHKRMIEAGLVSARWPLCPRDPEVPAWEEASNKDWQTLRMAVYAAQIDRMDRGIGRILEKIRAIGEEDNTLVLFLADNGGCAENLAVPRKPVADRTRDGRPIRRGNDPSIPPGGEETFQSYGPEWAHASNTPFRLYKHWVHEGGIATPLIASWPGRLRGAGSITHQRGHVIDILATCLDAGRAEYPASVADHRIKPLEGKSLLPAFEGRRRAGHDALFWEHEGNRAVRQGDWKLVSRHPDRWELYDLKADRTELNDLAAKHPDRVSRMEAQYRSWAERCGVLPWDEVRRAPARS